MNFDLINEIGHELKNKLGIIGNFLSEISSSNEIDKESLSDALDVYKKIISLSKVLSELRDESENGKTESKILRILLEHFSNQDTDLTENLSYTFIIQSENFVASHEININSINTSPISFIKNPRTGIEKIISLAIKEISKLKEIKILIKQGESLVDEVELK